MEIVSIKSEVSKEKKKRGPKPKNEGTGIVENKEQFRFVIDLSRDEKERELIISSLKEANNKSYGREISLKDLIFLLLTKITSKDIEKLKEASLTEMEKVQRLLDDYNLKNNCDLSLGEFLVKKLNIN
ncbi:MAG: hypothetical protein ACOYL6_17410 [Bacteriovoracaceae bacterium]